MKASIRVEDLRKKYRVAPPRGVVANVRARSQETDILWALDGVSLAVEAGEAVGIIGHNGAGKSTLLKILSRITEPTSGTAILRGRVTSLLGVGAGFHQELTGKENIYLTGAILGMRRREINARIDEIVSFSELERFLYTPVKHYSSGMQMRLAFGIAAYLDAGILLMDEVLAVGDEAFQRKCFHSMEESISKGRVVLLVSHDLPSVQRLCGRSYLLEKGRVAQTGPTCEVIEAYFRSLTK